jgi:hypothetical protein
MEIRVEQCDIAYGCRKNCESCPVALAILRRTGLTRVAVRNNRAYLYSAQSRTGVGFQLTEEVKRFISIFDSWGSSSVSPFSFTIPDELIERARSVQEKR